MIAEVAAELIGALEKIEGAEAIYQLVTVSEFYFPN
jgi:hypothetical protein